MLLAGISPVSCLTCFRSADAPLLAYQTNLCPLSSGGRLGRERWWLTAMYTQAQTDCIPHSLINLCFYGNDYLGRDRSCNQALETVGMHHRVCHTSNLVCTIAGRSLICPDWIGEGKEV